MLGRFSANSEVLSQVPKVLRWQNCNIQIRKSSATATQVLEDINTRKITDYSRFISGKSSRREPAITRIITALSYKYGKSLISLAEGMPNEMMFPFEDITVKLKDGTVLKLKDKELNMALQYIPSLGLPKLITTLKKFQQEMHKPPNWKESDLIVTTGSQDGIYKSIELLVNKGDSLLVPSPVYSGADIVMKPYKPNILEVSQDRYGMIPDKIREAIEKCKLNKQRLPRVIYVNPTGNNPTGTVIPNERRQEIYDICCEYDLIILEDDPYHFMSFTEEVPRSFQSFDVEGRVLRFDSLSKVISSGLRIGWVSGPKPLIDIIELHMQASYLHCSTLTQMITNQLMEAWGREGMEKHLGEIRKFYRMKRDCLLESLNRHLGDLAEWDVPEAGMFIWIKVKGVPDVYDMIVNKAFEKGITFAPGHAFTVSSSNPCPYIRASYSRASPEDIEKACIRLAELIRSEQALYAGFTPIQ